MNLEELTAKEMAPLFGVSDRAVQQWAEAGMPFIPVKGKVHRYCWKACFAWWLANRYKGTTAPSRNGGPPSLAESKARREAVLAARDEMRLEKEAGRLVSLDEIEPAWLRVAETVKNRVLTMVPKAKEKLPHLSTEDLKVLNALCREALEELSQCPASTH